MSGMPVGFSVNVEARPPDYLLQTGEAWSRDAYRPGSSRREPEVALGHEGVSGLMALDRPRLVKRRLL